MKLLATVTVSIFLLVLALFTPFLVLTAKTHHDEGMRTEMQAEVKRLRKAHKECSAAWPRFGKNYDECLEIGQVDL